jgi:hypothetical protein
MKDFITWLGDLRINNLADYGVLADTIEVAFAIVMMIGGIIITHRFQKWADKSGEQPGAVNVGQGGGYDKYEQRGIRN